MLNRKVRLCMSGLLISIRNNTKLIRIAQHFFRRERFFKFNLVQIDMMSNRCHIMLIIKDNVLPLFFSSIVADSIPLTTNLDRISVAFFTYNTVLLQLQRESLISGNETIFRAMGCPVVSDRSRRLIFKQICNDYFSIDNLRSAITLAIGNVSGLINIVFRILMRSFNIQTQFVCCHRRSFPVNHNLNLILFLIGSIQCKVSPCLCNLFSALCFTVDILPEIISIECIIALL